MSRVIAAGICCCCAEPPLRRGFGLKEQPAPFAGARWLAMGNGVMLHLVGNRTAPSDHGRWDHIALPCDDMGAMIK